VHVVGKYNPGVDIESCTGAHLPNGVALRTTSKFDRGSTRFGVKKNVPPEPDCAITRHEGSARDLGDPRNALRCSALRSLLAEGWDGAIC
jgi:hypothetical protein